MSATGVPIVLCEKVPHDFGPVLLLPGQPCPFCGEPIADHETIDGATSDDV